jgi:hypothetical protein
MHLIAKGPLQPTSLAKRFFDVTAQALQPWAARIDKQ